MTRLIDGSLCGPILSSSSRKARLRPQTDAQRPDQAHTGSIRRARGSMLPSSLDLVNTIKSSCAHRFSWSAPPTVREPYRLDPTGQGIFGMPDPAKSKPERVVTRTAPREENRTGGREARSASVCSGSGGDWQLPDDWHRVRSIDTGALQQQFTADPTICSSDSQSTILFAAAIHSGPDTLAIATGQALIPKG
jgi:hypothetical protein